MITVENLSYSIPEKELYNKISFQLEPNQHCALIGSSGTGKSTLLDMIMRPDDYLYKGKISIDSHTRIGYVSQFSLSDKEQDITVFDYVAQEFIQLQADMDSICKRMEMATDLDALLEQYQQLLDKNQAMDGDNYESNIIKTLAVADLGKLARQTLKSLSGGEFQLVQVIKEMMTQPELMIMDEPDVFLDFEHQNSLKNLINNHKGMMLVVTHNRYLLNHCFNKILHLENTKLQEFNGRYIDYNFFLLQTKIERMELSLADELEIERNEQIVQKLRNDATVYTCASRGRALNARVSLLERLKARKVEAPFLEINQPHIEFKTTNERTEGIAFRIADYDIAYDDTLLEHVSFDLGVKEKVALIGPNGSGKTTLLRDIYLNQKPSIIRNEAVTVAFQSQTAQDLIDDTLTNKSGGELNLLQLERISSYNANLLLLDEPTSHLDTYAQEALETAIKNFNGAILMVSHDFYMIADCMDYVLLIEDKAVRKISTRAFRKMIYANHFDKEYLEIEDKKKQVELRITQALRDSNLKLAKSLLDKLEELNKLL